MFRSMLLRSSSSAKKVVLHFCIPSNCLNVDEIRKLLSEKYAFHQFMLSLDRVQENMNSLVMSLAPKLVKLQTLVLRQGKPQLEYNAVEAIMNQPSGFKFTSTRNSESISSSPEQLSEVSYALCRKR